MTMTRILCALAAAVAVVGCQNPQVADTAVTSLLESTIGDDKGQVPPTAVGTLLGAFIGTEVGKALDGADRSLAESAARNGLETSPVGKVSNWSNPANAHSGTFAPVNIYHSADGLLCRDYDLGVTVAGRTQTADGTACRTSAGAWRIVETPARRSIRPQR